MSTSLLDLNIMDTPELETVPAGEYQMRITRAYVALTKPREGQAKELIYGLNLTMALMSLEGKKSIRYWISLESKKEATADQKQMDALRLKGMIVATGIDQSDLIQAYQQSRSLSGVAVDVPELVGLEPFAIVTEPAEDPQYGLQNRISRFVTSR